MEPFIEPLSSISPISASPFSIPPLSQLCDFYLFFLTLDEQVINALHPVYRLGAKCQKWGEVCKFGAWLFLVDFDSGRGLH